MLRNNLTGTDETGKVAQWAWFPLKAFSASFSLDVSGMLKCVQCMETGYVSRILRFGRIPFTNNPMLLPAKPVKSIAAAHMLTLQQNLSVTRSKKIHKEPLTITGIWVKHSLNSCYRNFKWIRIAKPDKIKRKLEVPLESNSYGKSWNFQHNYLAPKH